MTVPTALEYRVSANENPFPPPPPVLAAINGAAGHANRYPDVYPSTLVEALAEHHSVPTDHIAVGAGAAGLIQQMLHLVARGGGEAVIGWRSFEGYPLIAEALRVPVRRVPLRGAEHDLPAMAKAVRRRTKIVFLCSPNNPTGAALRHDELLDFLRRVPSRVFVVLDEVYRDFATDPATADGLRCYRDFPNVVVLRSFSKGYGLADLRVGYAIGQPGPIGGLRSVTMPFLVPAVAQAAAVAALGLAQQYQEQRAAIVAERERVWQALTGAGLAVPRSEGNFVWLPLGAGTAAFADTCARAGLQVHAFDGEGVRVTIGSASANDRLLELAGSLAGTD